MVNGPIKRSYSAKYLSPPSRGKKRINDATVKKQKKKAAAILTGSAFSNSLSAHQDLVHSRQKNTPPKQAAAAKKRGTAKQNKADKLAAAAKKLRAKKK